LEVLLWYGEKESRRPRKDFESASWGWARLDSLAANQERDDTEILAPATPEDPPEQCVSSYWLVLAKNASLRASPGTIFSSGGVTSCGRFRHLPAAVFRFWTTKSFTGRRELEESQEEPQTWLPRQQFLVSCSRSGV
jgi:hypothetical protein